VLFWWLVFETILTTMCMCLYIYLKSIFHEEARHGAALKKCLNEKRTTISHVKRGAGQANQSIFKRKQQDFIFMVVLLLLLCEKYFVKQFKQ